MIKNVIFDVGNVLVDWNWEGTLESLGYEGEFFEAMADATVCSKRFEMWETGKYADEDIIEMMKLSAPDFEVDVERVIENLPYAVETYYYAASWIQDLKNRGYQVYILSNYSRYLYEATKQKLRFVQYADGAVFSYETGYVKPQPEIYQYLFDKYSLNPEECVYLDDRYENIEAGAFFGMETVWVRDYEEAYDKLEAILSKN